MTNIACVLCLADRGLRRMRRESARFGANFLWQIRLLEDEGRPQVCYKFDVINTDPIAGTGKNTAISSALEDRHCPWARRVDRRRANRHQRPSCFVGWIFAPHARPRRNVYSRPGTLGLCLQLASLRRHLWRWRRASSPMRVDGLKIRSDFSAFRRKASRRRSRPLADRRQPCSPRPNQRRGFSNIRAAAIEGLVKRETEKSRPEGLAC